MRKLLLLFVLFWAAIGDASSAHTTQVTIGAATTRVTTTDTYARQIIFQNNAANSMRVGDSATTSTRGALLASGSPGGSMNLGPTPTGQSMNLAEWYVNGTNTQVLDVIWID